MATITVVVPTRDRADTLQHTLRTLVNQDYSGLEILVSDNASEDDTRSVVQEFADPRVRYVRTDRRVSMADNWEFALQHATGKYLTYIGDDDGFLPGSIQKLVDLLERSGSRAVVWAKAEYHWPDHIDEGMRNWFAVGNRKFTIAEVDGRKLLPQVVRFRKPYTSLPCLYNGAVLRSIVDECRRQGRNGMFFHSISPDLFSAMALAIPVGRYLYTDFHFSVNGASRHSNGTSFMRQKVEDKSTPAARFMSENAVQYDGRVQMTPSICLCVMGEYLQVQKQFEFLHLPEPDWKVYIKRLASSARGSANARQILDSAAHTAAAVGLPLPKVDVSPCAAGPAVAPLGPNGNAFCFRVPDDMVTNVFDACRLLAAMLPEGPEAQRRATLGEAARAAVKAVLHETRRVIAPSL